MHNIVMALGKRAFWGSMDLFMDPCFLLRCSIKTSLIQNGKIEILVGCPDDREQGCTGGSAGWG